MHKLLRGRLGRLRRVAPLRALVRETQISVNDLIYPLFVTHGDGAPAVEVDSMPGIYQLPLDQLAPEIESIAELGIPAVLVFGIPKKKDGLGTQAYTSNGIVQQAVEVIKNTVPELLVITDVCLCEYTDHGHCGVLINDLVDNDATVELLAKTAISQVNSGADIVAPSAMMDGQVAAIRASLDGQGFLDTPIMAYSAKYASDFYAPFRSAANSVPKSGDRKAYQIDYHNAREGLREIEQDIKEGADIVMVKPALAYLDVISRARKSFSCPIAAYNVSGEYAMVKAAKANGWLNEPRVVKEILGGIKRAGADMVITYHAKDMAKWLSS